MNFDFMKVAVDEAHKAYNECEIPVGCVIVKDDKIIASGHNCKEKYKNCLLHAEIIAIDRASKVLDSWRLDDCVMYVTLEPCMMCMGAIIESRIKRVYYGTKNNGEQMFVLTKKIRDFSVENVENIECSKILSSFFENKRKK